MLYIHQSYCISPQQNALSDDMFLLNEAVEKKLFAIEPGYQGIPPGVLRRMGKAIRMGVGAALPICTNATTLSGIIIGTANGGMEDCIKFLNQMVQYDEGLLAPGNFVQSTNNAIAGQLGLLKANKKYNVTHVNRGLSFENALIDAMMQLKENPAGNYLLGAVDELSTYNYNIEKLANAYKEEAVAIKNIYTTDSPGCIAGEGAAMFVVNNDAANAIAKVEAISTIHSNDVNTVNDKLKKFIKENLFYADKIDLFLSGENGDNRVLKFYTACEKSLDAGTSVGRFKHLCGEYPTATSFALWLCCQFFQTQKIPSHIYKAGVTNGQVKTILFYNNYKGYQHSFMLVKYCC